MALSGSPGNAPDHSYYAALSSTAVLVVGAKANLFGVQLEAGAAEVQYLNFYNAATAAAVTVGTTPIDWSILVLASDGTLIRPGTIPLKHFPLGIVIAAVKTSRTGSTAPATGAVVSVWYRRD